LHFILYPNPWPLKKDLKKRYHAHPVFHELVRLGKRIELRSNWSLYLQEFSHAYQYISGRSSTVESFTPEIAITPFERKYMNSGQTLYRLIIEK